MAATILASISRGCQVCPDNQEESTTRVLTVSRVYQAIIRITMAADSKVFILIRVVVVVSIRMVMLIRVVIINY